MSTNLSNTFLFWLKTEFANCSGSWVVLWLLLTASSAIATKMAMMPAMIAIGIANLLESMLMHSLGIYYQRTVNISILYS